MTVSDFFGVDVIFHPDIGECVGDHDGVGLHVSTIVDFGIA